MFEVIITTPENTPAVGVICDTLEGVVEVIEDNTPGVYNKPVTLEGVLCDPDTLELKRYRRGGYMGYWVDTVAATTPEEEVGTVASTSDGLFIGFLPVTETTSPNTGVVKPVYAHTTPCPINRFNLRLFMDHVNRKHPEYTVNVLEVARNKFYL